VFFILHSAARGTSFVTSVATDVIRERRAEAEFLSPLPPSPVTERWPVLFKKPTKHIVGRKRGYYLLMPSTAVTVTSVIFLTTLG
jgi:hypothetical protein